MTKEDYKSIRTKRGFLYHYFVMSGGRDVGEYRFNIMLGIWVGKYNPNTQEGFRQIVIFLDKKFDY